MTAYTESEKHLQDVRKAVRKHQTQKLDTITVRVPKGKKDEYYEAAERAGVPFRQYFMDAMEKMIDSAR